MIELDIARRRANELKTEADELLTQKGILEALDKYGNVQFTGSYAADLMVKPDIDVQVINPRITGDDVIELANFFFSMKGNYSVEVADGTEYRRALGHPVGYYVGPWTIFKDRKWKMDIWLLKEHQEISETPYSSLRKHDWYKEIDQSEKDAILLIKHQLAERGEYSSYASANVYEAVITGKARTLTQFFEWAETFDIEQLFNR